VAIVLPKLPRFRTSTRTFPNTPPALTVELCRADGKYVAGKPLRASWRVGETTIDEVVGLEASVLWYTEGKGEGDLHIHHFTRWNDMHLQDLDLTAAHEIDCVLPHSPVSYAGTLIRICWCVRVRLFRSEGRTLVTQQPFYLVGELDAAESPLYASTTNDGT